MKTEKKISNSLQLDKSIEEIISFNNPLTIVYVEDSYNEKLNGYIQANYKQICELFDSKGVNFCYLPNVMNSHLYQNIVRYNHPHIAFSADKIKIAEIYQLFIQQNKFNIDGSAFVYFEWMNGSFTLIHKVINPLLPLPIQFEKTANHLKQMYLNYQRDYKPLQYHIVSQDYSNEDADGKFNYEAFKLTSEILERVNKLRENGMLKLINKIVDEIQDMEPKLSRLVVSADYTISLPEFNIADVPMPPLSKCLYILFLRHPNGIMFKHLGLYKQELLTIYREITKRENSEAIIESINAMTDPLNNSVNEKCSRIHAAFVERIKDDIAENYYITGRKGEAKKILVDRNLIHFE